MSQNSSEMEDDFIKNFKTFIMVLLHVTVNFPWLCKVYMRCRARGRQDNPMGLVSGPIPLGKGYIRIVFSSSNAFEYLMWKDNVIQMKKSHKQISKKTNQGKSFVKLIDKSNEKHVETP